MPNSFENHTIIVIGGAIAGCTIAALLKDIDGITVKVIEKENSTQFKERGAGIVLPKALLDKCIELKLFNPNIPYVSINKRSFWVTEPSGELRNIWQQPITLVALNWSTLFDNLRRRVPVENYHAGQKVHKIVDIGKQVIVGSTTGEEKCDLLIAADGVNSIVRTRLYPESKADYAGYIAWRGTIPMSAINMEKQFQENFHYFVFPDQRAEGSSHHSGHLLIFPIPGTKAGEVLINWMLYEPYPEKELQSLLVDKAGNSQKISLPRGMLAERHIKHLHALANKVLPTQIAAIVTQTKEPFLQIIFDALVPNFVNGNICFLGDAGMTLRPHSGSGAGHALAFTIAFVEALKNNSVLSLSEKLQQWNQGRLEYAQQQLKLSKNLGDALVMQSPPWSNMTQETMDLWWKSVIAGRSWHVTENAKDKKDETPNTLFFLPETKITEHKATVNTASRRVLSKL